MLVSLLPVKKQSQFGRIGSKRGKVRASGSSRESNSGTEKLQQLAEGKQTQQLFCIHEFTQKHRRGETHSHTRRGLAEQLEALPSNRTCSSISQAETSRDEIHALRIRTQVEDEARQRVRCTKRAVSSLSSSRSMPHSQRTLTGVTLLLPLRSLRCYRGRRSPEFFGHKRCA